MANNITVTQGSGTTLKTTDNAGVHTPHHNVDALAAGASADIGATGDAAWGGSGAGSLIAIAKAIWSKLNGALTVATHAVRQSGTWNVGTVTTVSAVTAISNALPAGSNAIGKLAANSGVDIGDVDVTSVTAGSR